MKKKLFIISLVSFLLLGISLNVGAEETGKEYKKMYTTAYCTGRITRSGEEVRIGICAVKEEWMYQKAYVYAYDDGKCGQLLGVFDCLDTGFGADSDGDGVGSIEEGKVIDIYFPSLELCREWMKLTGGRCYVLFEKDNELEKLKK